MRQADIGLLGGFGASAARQVVAQAGNTGLLPCAYTFSKDYVFSEPYFPQVNESDAIRLDSTFLPDPLQGWFGLGNLSTFQPPILGLNYFQTAPWFHLAIDSGVSDAEIQALGSRNKAAAIANPLGILEVGGTGGGRNSSNNTLITPGQFNVINDTIAEIATTSADVYEWSGILGNIDPMLFFNITVNGTTFTNFVNQSGDVLDTIQNDFTISNLALSGLNLSGLQPLPWFTNTTLVTDNDLDDLISTDILRTVNQLTSVNASARGVRLGYWSGAILRYPAVAAAIQAVSNMPWGVLRFSSVDNGTYAYMIQAGTDVRLQNVASYPPEGLRRMAFQTMFERALCIYLKVYRI